MGDSAAFDEIFRRYHQDVFRYCRSIVRNEQDAMDALQNTMTTALAKLPGESREIRLKPWLFRVARNECIDSLNARRDQISPDGLELEGGSRVESEVADRERLREILSDIGRLPEGQRSALVMRELNGLTFEDIGFALDCTPAAARQAVYEARLSLKELESGRGMLCDEARQAISSMDGRVMRGRRLRAHLRSCDECEGFRLALQARQKELRSLVPVVPAAAAASILGAIGGGGGGIGGGLLAIFSGGGAAAGAGTKAVAILAVTAGIGAGTAGVVNRIESAGKEPGSAVVSEPGPDSGPGQPSNSAIPVSITGSAIGDSDRPKVNGLGQSDRDENPGAWSRDPSDPDAKNGSGLAGEADPSPVGGPGAVPAGEPTVGKPGRSEQAPGRAEGGPPGKGAGRPAGTGGGNPGATPVGPPAHAQGRPAKGGQSPVPRPPTDSGKPGSASSGLPPSPGGSSPPGRGGKRKSAGTP